MTTKYLHHPLSIQRLNSNTRFLLPLTILLLAILACNFPKLRVPAKATQVNEAALTSPNTALAAANNNLPSLDSTSAISQREVILHWQGSIPGGPASCHNLEVTSDHQASFGPCNEQPQVVPFNPPQWDEILLRIAPFEISSTDVKVTFRGQGNSCGPAWERAVIRWAQEAYTSLYTGHACAACNTVLNWSFGEMPGAQEAGTCHNFWVTDYGYAYLGEVPCQGGQALIKASGWLETGELAQLDAWLTSRAEVHLGETGASYFLGTGSQAMSEEEISQLAAWSQQVKSRLSAGQ